MIVCDSTFSAECLCMSFGKMNDCMIVDVVSSDSYHTALWLLLLMDAKEAFFGTGYPTE